MTDSKFSLVHRAGSYIGYLKQYDTMLSSLVKKEFKGRFKYTALGYFWHLLTPLFQIVMFLLIFTVIFGKDIPNYWVYVSTGMFAFTLFSVSIAGGCDIITKNKAMVTKMAFPREILVFSSVITALINLLISYALLAVLMVLSGVGITVNILFVPLIIAISAVFCVGAAFLMSSITVYLRDISNATKIVMGCLMFATPIMYLTTQMNNSLVQTIWYMNPMFYYIESIHNAFYFGIPPEMNYMVIGAVCAVAMLIIGWYVFKRLEKGFADRL